VGVVLFNILQDRIYLLFGCYTGLPLHTGDRRALYFIPQPRRRELHCDRLFFEALLRSDARLGAGASLARTAASSTACALRRSEVVNLKSSVLQKYVKRSRE